MNFLTKHSTVNSPVLRIVVFVLFITFPIIGFALGMSYKGNTEISKCNKYQFNNVAPTPSNQLIKNEKIEVRDYWPNDNVNKFISRTYRLSFEYPVELFFSRDERGVIELKDPKKVRIFISYRKKGEKRGVGFSGIGANKIISKQISLNNYELLKHISYPRIIGKNNVEIGIEQIPDMIFYTSPNSNNLWTPSNTDLEILIWMDNDFINDNNKVGKNINSYYEELFDSLIKSFQFNFQY